MHYQNSEKRLEGSKFDLKNLAMSIFCRTFAVQNKLIDVLSRRARLKLEVLIGHFLCPLWSGS